MGTFRFSAATLEVSEASKLGHEMATTPLKSVPSALKSVSLMVVRGGVAASFELSARTHSRHNRRRNIRPPGKPRIPAPEYSPPGAGEKDAARVRANQLSAWQRLRTVGILVKGL